MGRLDEWKTFFRIISFNSRPEALAYRKDVVAAGLYSGDIVVLDAVTGLRRSVLSGHKGCVTSLTFSLDGTLLASGGADRTIKLWDIQTGGVVKTFHTSIYQVCSVSISPDATTIASGSHNNTICLWDVRTGEGPRTIKISPQRRVVTCIDFLPDLSGHIVSVSDGGSVQRWNVNGNKVGPQTYGRHIAFSLDGKRFVLCGEGALTVRDSASGAVITTLHSPGQRFRRCCFSPNGEFIAGAAGQTIYVWNIAGTHQTSRLVRVFPHDRTISSLLYTTSLISAHRDGKVRFCQVGGDSPDSTVTDIESTTLVSPARITLQGREGFATTLDSVGTVLLWDLSTGLPKTLIKGVGEGSARLVNGVLITVSRHWIPEDAWEISTWDVKTGKKVRTAFSSTPPDWHEDNAIISEDGSTLLSAGPSRIQTWSTLTGQAGRSVDLEPSSPISETPSLGSVSPKPPSLRSVSPEIPFLGSVSPEIPSLGSGSPEIPSPGSSSGIPSLRSISSLESVYSRREFPFEVASIRSYISNSPNTAREPPVRDPKPPLRYPDPPSPSLVSDGSTVWVLFGRSIKWLDLRNLELRPFDSCETAARPGGKSIQLIGNEVMDVTSGSVFFRLPQRDRSYCDKHWDGRYLVAVIGTEVLIIDFVHVFPQ